ncbi:MAG: saccharopine dehydrogenase family protein [Myxococcota bacterium]
MSPTDREFDVILWGATGFTGRLVGEYLLGRYGTGGDLRWAIAGRNPAKLETVRASIGSAAHRSAEELPILVGDGDDESSLRALAERTRVVCTTVGPYAKYGSKLVHACAGLGTHYCDLTGEVQWMRRMIDAHQKEAEASGARIVHNCGFDSIPSDLGVYFLQQAMRQRHGISCSRIAYRVKGFSGGFSGGTAASLLNVMEEATADPDVRQIMADPYSLNPPDRRSGPDGREAMGPFYDADFGEWTAPFVMAAINTRVVRRTNALLGLSYGADFRYDEATLMGPGVLGLAKATAFSAALGATMAAGALGPLRSVLGSLLPSPGEGPSAAQREAGYFDIRLFGAHPDDANQSLRGRVTGDRDPGYGSTARMLGESAVCLAKDDLRVAGGFWTPASAMGAPLLERLQANAGLTFTLQDN